MSPPLPVMIAFAVLLGWPTIKLIVALLSIRKRRKFQRLLKMLRAQYSGNEDASSILDDAEQRSHGELLQVLLPPMILLGAPIAAFMIAQEKPVKTHSGGNPQENYNALVARIEAANIELAKGMYSEENMATVTDLYKNDDFKKMSEIEFSLSMRAYPVSSILSIATAIVISPIFLAVLGVGLSFRVVPQYLVRASAHSARVFQQDVLAMGARLRA